MTVDLLNGPDRQLDSRKATVVTGYDAMGPEYGAWSARICDPGRELMTGRFARLLRPHSRVLDLGCGPGIPSTASLAQRFAVTGVDVSERQLAAARRNVPTGTFILGDLATVDFDAGSFEGVIALYSISHVPRDEHAAVFARVARWLTPGGLFLASLGARNSPDWTGDWLGQQMFFSSFDADENRRLVAAAGFDLLFAEVIGLDEPEGPTSFLWVLAQSKSRSTSAHHSSR
jgi:SAM-dependent methyltransferase